MGLLHSADQADVIAYDATQQAYETTITLVSGKRYAFGVVALTAASGTVTFSIGGVSKATRNVDPNNLANRSTDYYEDGNCWEADTSGSVTFRAEITSGTWDLEGVVIREADAESGVVEDQGAGTHCYPLACVYDGDRYQIHAEMYTGLRTLSINGVYEGVLFGGSNPGGANNRYHYGIALVPLSTGILAVAAPHSSSQIRVQYLPGGVLASASTTRLVGGASSVLTYCQCVADASDNVYIATRGRDDGSGTGALIYKITNATDLVANDVTYTVDTVMTSLTTYPRSIAIQTSGGVPVICTTWAGGSGSGTFSDAWAALFAPTIGTHGEWYTLGGTDATVQTALGTVASPRFNSTMVSDEVEDGGLRLFGALINNVNVQYLPEAALFECTRFPVLDTTTAKGRLFVPRVLSLGSQDGYGAAAIQYQINDEDALPKISPNDFQEPHRWMKNPPDPNSHRIGACLRWLDDDPTTNEAILWLTDRGTRLHTNQYGETSELYYDWGGTTIRRFRIANPMTAPVFTLNSSHENPGSGLPAAFITAVAGETNKAIYQTADNELHQTHRQSTRVLLDDGGGANTEVVESLDSAWTTYKTITVDSTNIDANLTYYPLLVKFSSDTDIGAIAASNGHNIRFTKADGTTLLNYKRRSFSITGGAATGVFLVMTDLASTPDTVIRIYYDNSGAADGEATAQKIGDSAHYIIASLDQDPSGSAPQITDDTWRGNNGTSAGSMTDTDSVAGILGNALDFDGSNDEINFGNTETSPDKIGRSHALTIESWVMNNTSQLTGDGIIFSRGNLSTTSTCHAVWRDDVGVAGNNLYSFLPRAGSTTIRAEMAPDSANAADVWDYVAFSYRGDATDGIKGYLNGVQSGPSYTMTGGTRTLNDNDPALDVKLGRDGTATNRYWDGKQDEFRLSLTDRSAAWLKFTYHNISSVDNELTFGAEQGPPGIDSTTHGHQSSEVILSQSHFLSNESATHGHTSSEVTLTQTQLLAVDSATHSQQSSEVALTQTQLLAAESANHGHSSSEAVLSSASVIVAENATHGHASSEALLSQTHIVSVDSSTHSQTSTEVTLEAVDTISVHSSTHGHDSLESTLSQTHVVTVDSSTHGHQSTEVVVSTSATLDIGDATHGQTSTVVVLPSDEPVLIPDTQWQHWGPILLMQDDVLMAQAIGQSSRVHGLVVIENVRSINHSVRAVTAARATVQ